MDITGLVPVELNAILAMNARLLSEWFEYFGDTEKAEKYRQISITLIQYIDEVSKIYKIPTKKIELMIRKFCTNSKHLVEKLGWCTEF